MIPQAIIGKLTYSGNCVEYNTEANSVIHTLFSDAKDLAAVISEDSGAVLNLTRERFLEILDPKEDFVPEGKYQMNVVRGIAWVYIQSQNICYFYSL